MSFFRLNVDKLLTKLPNPVTFNESQREMMNKLTGSLGMMGGTSKKSTSDDETKKSGEDGALLNINADTVAGNISAALNAERMIFLTDVEGIMDSSKRLLPRITRRQADSLIRSNIISGGMLPKIGACISALDGGAVSQIIDGRKPGALKEAISGEKLGTRIG